MSWTVILCITVVSFAVVFFITTLLHLLVRYLLKQRPRSNSDNNPQISNSSAAFQRQLQQLFHLHDSGLDQAHVDALPVFSYKDVVGSKEPFDCAVCLCEFSEEDKLRLLPLCRHAFHIDCIDAWLLSNSTCPLCRGVILSPENHGLTDFDDSKETEDLGTANAGFLAVIRPNPPDHYSNSSAISEKRVFSVRLGKFKNVADCGPHYRENEQIGDGVEETSNGHLDARRCYSMGSFQYVVADMDLQVAAERPLKGLLGNFTTGGGQEEDGDGIGKKISSGAKGESFSISKIWLWSRKGQSSLSAVNLDLP